MLSVMAHTYNPSVIEMGEEDLKFEASHELHCRVLNNPGLQRRSYLKIAVMILTEYDLSNN